MRTTIGAALMMGLVVPFALVSAHVGGPAAAGQAPQRRSAFSGQTLFNTYCASCHGGSAKGDGPFAKNLRKRPPDLTQLAKQHHGTFPTERVAKVIDGREMGPAHAKGDMPVWGDAFSRTTNDNDAESVRLKIDALVTFVESLQERPTSE